MVCIISEITIIIYVKLYLIFFTTTMHKVQSKATLFPRGACHRTPLESQALSMRALGTQLHLSSTKTCLQVWMAMRECLK